MLQHVEFEVYVNKYIWFQKKTCKTKCGYHTMTKLHIISAVEKLFLKI